MRSRSILNRLLSNWPAKILSLAAAIVIFMFYRMSTLEERFFSVPVQVVLPKGFAISGEYENRVKVTIRGDENVIYPILENDIVAYVDLTKHNNAGKFKAPVKIEKRGTAKNVKSIEIRVEPPELTLTIEEIITRSVPVKAIVKGSPKHGYELVSYTITPDKVQIEGPKSHVERIKELLTDKIDISGRETAFTKKVKLIVNDKYVKIKGNETVDFYAMISEVVILKTFDNIDIISLDLDPSLRLSSPLPTGSIKVQGPQLLIESLNSGQIRLIVNCSEIKEKGKYLLPVVPEAPSGIIVLSYEPKEVLLQFNAFSKEANAQ